MEDGVIKVLFESFRFPAISASLELLGSFLFGGLISHVFESFQLSRVMIGR